MSTINAAIQTPERPRLGQLSRRAVLGTLVVAVVAAAGFFGWSAVARYNLASAHPPPGQLLDVGGYRLHLHCMGHDDGPTVILEAGNADFSVIWAKVQPELAIAARVCAYDRAGLGWSERGTTRRTLDVMTEELSRLLDAAGIDGKLLLVGHSFGGILARSFAAAHPDRVTGLVLIDPAHERQLDVTPTMRMAVARGVAQFESLVPLASWGLLAILPGSIPTRGLPEAAHSDYAAVLATTAYFSVAAEETAMLPANLEATAASGADLGDLPLTVLSRGKGDGPTDATTADLATMEEAWRDLQIDIASLSTDSRHIVAEESGHYVQLDRPDLVVEAVRTMLERL